MSTIEEARAMSAKQYRKKPVVIEAMQVLDDIRVHHEICEWAKRSTDEGKVIPVVMSSFDSHLIIHTLEGTMHADLGDWIIRGVQGEFYPCKPDIFEQTYEAVES